MSSPIAHPRRSPRQERFALEHLADIESITVLTVGGLFDYFAGRVPRALAMHSIRLW